MFILNDIPREFRSDGPMLRILVAMESMSAEFMGAFGNPKGLTPNLDRLAIAFHPADCRPVDRSPPRQGGSLHDRLGFPGFIYGGNGYFDNMNAFFSGNGFGIVDRGAMTSGEVRFANAWGVSDGDLYDEVIRQADASIENEKNFVSFVLNRTIGPSPSRTAPSTSCRLAGETGWSNVPITRLDS